MKFNRPEETEARAGRQGERPGFCKHRNAFLLGELLVSVRELPFRLVGDPIRKGVGPGHYLMLLRERQGRRSLVG